MPFYATPTLTMDVEVKGKFLIVLYLYNERDIV